MIDPLVEPPTKMILKNASVINPDYQKWWRNDQLVLSWILSSLTEETISLAIGITTPPDLWKILRETLEIPRSQGYIVQI